MQGFVPLLVIREYFIRKSIINSKKLFPWIILSIPLALAAIYEFIEWWTSLLSGSAGDSFLGTQGYIWDTQSDMLFCLIGSVVALIIFSKLQDKYISGK
jgi:putative membrane protein